MKMINGCKVIGLLLVTVVLFCTATADSITTQNREMVGGARNVLSGKEIHKTTEFLKEIRNNMLYTETGAYSTANARVTYRTDRSKVIEYPGRKRLAELVFVNGILKEVVIHP